MADPQEVKYEVITRPPHEMWNVEGIDYENDGVVYMAQFSGPRASERAQEYARFKNGEGNGNAD